MLQDFEGILDGEIAVAINISGFNLIGIKGSKLDDVLEDIKGVLD